MLIRGSLRIRNDGERGDNAFQILLSSQTMLATCSLHAMPQFGYRDRRNFEVIVSPGSQPTAKIKRSLFAPNNHIGIDDYRHLSLSALSLLRAMRTSFAHDSASAVGKSNPSSASASSRPLHTFSGTKLASGVPLRSNTYCTS